MTLVYLGVGAALGIAAVWLWRRWAARRASSPASLMKRLVKLTHDPDVARRLVEGERSREPELSEVQLLKRVLRRLQRDRRR